MIKYLMILMCLPFFALQGASSQEQAEVLEGDGDVRGALDIYAALLQKDPENIEFLYQAGRLYGLLQEWVPAENSLKACLRKDPDHTDARIILSYVYYWQKKYREAIAEAEDVLARYPDNVDALLVAGNAYRISLDRHKAERYFKKALQLKPDLYEAHLFMASLMHTERRYHKAYTHYLFCLQKDPSDLFAERGVIATKPLTRPSIEIKSFYAQEREQDLLAPVTTTQMTTMDEALRVTYPVNDRWMPYVGILYDLQMQYNLVARTNNYQVNSYFQNIGAFFRFGEFWSLDIESKVHFARNKGLENILPFKNVTKWEPRTLISYLNTEHFFVFSASKDSIIARLFSLNQSQLIPKKGLETAYEYRFKVPYNGLGLLGSVAWYGGAVPNRDQGYSLWLRFRIPSIRPDLLVRYEFAYRGFKDVVGAYNSFKWRNQHLGKITYHKEWVPKAHFDFSYSYLWSDTHELTNQSEIVLSGAPNIPAPIHKNIFRANIVEVLAHYVAMQSFHLELTGRYYHDTNRYRSWALFGRLEAVF